MIYQSMNFFFFSHVIEMAFPSYWHKSLKWIRSNFRSDFEAFPHLSPWSPIKLIYESGYSPGTCLQKYNIMKMKFESCQTSLLPQIKLGRYNLPQETWKETRNRRAENSLFNKTKGEEGCHEEKVHQEWFLSYTRAMWSGVGNQEQWIQSYSEAKQGPDVSNQFPVWDKVSYEAIEKHAW